MADPEVFYDLWKTNAERRVRKDALQTLWSWWGLCNTPLLFPLTQAFNNSIVKRCYQKVSNLVSNISYKPLCASMLQDGRSPWMQYPGIQRRSKPYATLLGCYTERLHLLSKHQDPLLSSATSGPNYLFICKTLLAPLWKQKPNPEPRPPRPSPAEPGLRR